ncbi:hypothetical protein BC830DRAFT_897808 [Chytriomyces sp. MP71]|nr:hypothetical protein BC830DRAFT_897808 [Chytriomyces sp. MP71]
MRGDQCEVNLNNVVLLFLWCLLAGEGGGALGLRTSCSTSPFFLFRRPSPFKVPLSRLQLINTAVVYSIRSQPFTRQGFPTRVKTSKTMNGWFGTHLVQRSHSTFICARLASLRQRKNSIRVHLHLCQLP